MAQRRNRKKETISSAASTRRRTSRCNSTVQQKKKQEVTSGSWFRSRHAILFCGMYDLSLRGMKSEGGVLQDLLKFRVDAGGHVLETHLENCAKNARYTSVSTQNELVRISDDHLRADIVESCNKSGMCSLLADEPADISGMKQLTLGIRFVDMKSNVVRQEFVGMVPLEEMDADAISATILETLAKLGLNLENLVGQGYNGCSFMLGSISGVQARIRKKHPRALYFHCASHRLNFVVNKINLVPEVRNAVASIKSAIKLSRESPLRRKTTPSLPVLSGTRWGSKYKSICLFHQTLVGVMEAQQKLSSSTNKLTRETAHQLFCSFCTPSFLVCLTVIARYFALLEPVTNILKGIQMDILKVEDHIRLLVGAISENRENAEDVFKVLYSKVTIPCMIGRQVHRPNIVETAEEYYRRSIFISYLDSLLSALKTRFGERTTPAFVLLLLHPKAPNQLSDEGFRTQLCEPIRENSVFDSFEYEAELWCKSSQNSDFDGDLMDLLVFAEGMCPAISRALQTAVTFLATTCCPERSFSTMRGVKT